MIHATFPEPVPWSERARGLAGLTWFGFVWLFGGGLLALYGAIWSLGYEQLFESLGQPHYDRFVIDHGGFRLALFYSSRILVWQLSFTVLAVAIDHGIRVVAPRAGLLRRYAVAGALAACTLAFVHASSVNGWVSALAPGFGFETEYAPGYSEEAFREIEPGMLQEDVLQRLGEPLFRDWDHGLGLGYTPIFMDRGEECWHWSRSATYTHYSVRTTHFQDGVVSEKVAYIFWD